ncbi:MAG: hypothetical protein QM640_06015 [Niabella sp.]
MFKNLLPIITVSLLLASCGTQNRLTSVHKKTEAAKRSIQQESLMLDSVKQKISQKLKSSELDTALTGKFNNIILALQSDLEKIEQTVTMTEFLSAKKSNFNERNYYAKTKIYIDKIDSFRVAGYLRDRIYQLLNRAVSLNAFHKYELGAFFEPGAYRIPPTALAKVRNSFQPAIDSIIALSNEYHDVKSTIYIVFVGFADALPISCGTSLYEDLQSYLSLSNPEKAQLNLMLSNLRANELSRNIKILVQDNAHKFQNLKQFKVGYINYGRGEALPFNNINDYRDNDERRRVVVFYWSVLPDLN